MEDALMKRKYAANIFLTLSIVALAANVSFAQTENEISWEQPLDQILDMSIVTAGRRSQTVAKSAAPVFVITQDDIRRSGATTIPELLRLVPGFHVFQIDNSNELSPFAVGSRGEVRVFNGDILVLVDGRSVLHEIGSVTNWTLVNYLFDDIERIEVVRGPGSVLWGNNAVEGVVNIITKSASKTQGALARGRVGSEERGYAAGRYGGAFGDTSYRLYALGRRLGNSELVTGGPAYDRDTHGQFGFRTDTDLSTQDLFTWQGDVVGGKKKQALGVPSFDMPGTFDRIERNDYVTSANTVGRYTHTWDDRSETMLQGYFTYWHGNTALFMNDYHIFDIEGQHSLAATEWLDITFGGEHKFINDTEQGHEVYSFEPGSRGFQRRSAYIQGEAQLIKNLLSISAGERYEWVNWSGAAFSPDARILYTPSKNSTIWASFTQAIRFPSRGEVDGTANITTLPLDPFETGGLDTGLVRYMANPYLDTINSTTYQVGYKRQVTDNLNFDLTTYFIHRNNAYDDEPAGMPFVEVIQGRPVLVVPYQKDDKTDSESVGAEIAVDYRPVDRVRLAAAYSYMHFTRWLTDGGTDLAVKDDIRRYVPNEVNFRAMFDLSEQVQFNAQFRFVDDIPAIDIPAYTQLDLKLAYRPVRNLELSVVGQNLLRPDTKEYAPEMAHYDQSMIERGVYGQVLYTF